MRDILDGRFVHGIMYLCRQHGKFPRSFLNESDTQIFNQLQSVIHHSVPAAEYGLLDLACKKFKMLLLIASEISKIPSAAR